jgi:sec-independent protein translocase protein TatA
MNTLFTLGLIGGLGTGEIILIALVVLLLFGGRKIPELMRGMGKGVRNFKDGLKDVEDEIKKDVDEDKKGDDKKLS